MEGTLLGLEVGGTKIQLVAGRPDGTILRRWRHNVDRTRGAEGILAQIEGWLSEALPGQPGALGVGFGGPVERPAGRIARSHQIEGWSGFDFGAWLRRHLPGTPVVVDNDANVAALGEACRGRGRGAATVFYVTLGSGVGGGLVVDGRIYHGAKPGESEIGHVRLDKSGTLVEERCSGWAVDRRIRDAIALHPASPLARLAEGSPSGQARFLVAALEQGDPLAHAILSELADNLAFGLSHVVHLMHPERIVLGGGLALVGEPLRGAVVEALKPYLMEVFQPGPAVFLAELQEDAVPMGALLLASQALGVA